MARYNRDRLRLAAEKINYVIIYQSSKLSFSCVLLAESVSREIDEIKLSPSHQRERQSRTQALTFARVSEGKSLGTRLRERETMHYSPVNNEKNSRAPSREHATFGPPKTANVFLNLN